MSHFTVGTENGAKERSMRIAGARPGGGPSPVADDSAVGHHGCGGDRHVAGLPTTTSESSILPGSYKSVGAAHLQDQAFPQTGQVTRSAAIIMFARSDNGRLTAATPRKSPRSPQRFESDERIWAVAAWWDAPFFADAERAALAVTEAATGLSDRADPANPLASASDLSLGEADRVRATEYLSVLGVHGACAAGDGAAVPDLTRPGTIGGPTAQHAVRPAKTQSRNIVAGLRGRPLRSYRHRYLGSVATLGHGQGVTEAYRIRLHSLLAWLIARGYHLIGVPTLSHQARILADRALSMFFRADTIPLSDLEHAERELMPRRTSSNPRGTSADASGPGRWPADPVRSI
jgi:hypothetical protein